MYNLFETQSKIQYPKTIPPEFNFLQRSYRQELIKIISYYQERNFSLPMSHLLSKILTNASVSRNTPLEIAIEAVYSRSDAVARAMNISSPLSAGKLFNGPFYGESSDEFILHSSFKEWPEKFINKWKQLSPVSILLHPLSNMSLLQPIGKKVNTEEGISIFSIDIVLLVFQYRCFLIEQDKIQQRNDASFSAPLFIRKYVLPNMLYQQTDIVIINRLMNLFYGAPMGAALFRYPFPIDNYQLKIDSLLGKVIKHIENKKMRYEAMLQQIPCITKENAQTTLMLPEIAPTRQIYWLLIISRLSIIKFLIDIGGKNAIVTNRDEIVRLKRTLRIISIENQWPSMISSDILYNVESLIKELLAVN
jgi:hypothetical protein